MLQNADTIFTMDSSTDKKVPNGLRFHLIDIFVDEMEKLKPEEMASNPLPLEKLLEPFRVLVVKSPTKLVRTRSKDLLLDGRLVAWGFEGALEGKNKKWNVKPEVVNQSNEDVAMDIDSEEWGGIDD